MSALNADDVRRIFREELQAERARLEALTQPPVATVGGFLPRDESTPSVMDELKRNGYATFGSSREPAHPRTLRGDVEQVAEPSQSTTAELRKRLDSALAAIASGKVAQARIKVLLERGRDLTANEEVHERAEVRPNFSDDSGEQDHGSERGVPWIHRCVALDGQFAAFIEQLDSRLQLVGQQADVTERLVDLLQDVKELLSVDVVEVHGSPSGGVSTAGTVDDVEPTVGAVSGVDSFAAPDTNPGGAS